MAESTEKSIEIEGTPKEIMKVIGDFEAYPEWAGSDLKSIKVTKKDKQGRGKHVYYEVGAMGFKADYTLDYTYLAGDKGVTWTMVEGNNIKSLDGSYELEPAGKGHTTVTYTMRVEPGIPLPGLVRRQIEKKAVNAALNGLKKRVEEG